MQCNHTFPIISNFLIFLSSSSPLFCLMIYALLYFHPTKYFLILITKKSYIFVEILSIIFLQIKKLTIHNYYFSHKKIERTNSLYFLTLLIIPSALCFFSPSETQYFSYKPSFILQKLFMFPFKHKMILLYKIHQILQ